MDAFAESPYSGWLLGIATLVVGAFLNMAASAIIEQRRSSMERRRHFENRVWDHRRQDYSCIVAKVHNAALNARLNADGYDDYQYGPEAYHSSDRRRELQAEAWSAWTEALQAYDNARVIVSLEFQAAFERVEASIEAVDEHQLPPDIAYDLADAYKAGYTELLQVARSELSQP